MARSHSPPELGVGEADMMEFERKRCQDTVPLDDTLVALLHCSSSSAGNLGFDTKIVDNPDCVADSKLQSVIEEYDEEVVLDSEDDDEEGTCRPQLVSNTAELSDFKIVSRIESDVIDLQKQKPLHNSDGSAGEQCTPGAKGTLLDDGSTNGQRDLPQLLKCDRESPLSTYNALGFVDRFLSSSDVGFSPPTETTSTVSRKLSTVSSTNGPHSLAKCLKTRTIAVQDEIFEWRDDLLEGLDLSSKRMDASSDFGGCRETSLARYQLDSVLSGHESHIFGIEGNTLERCDVSFGTQMAAEAIESLSNGLLAYCSGGDACQGPQNSCVASTTSVAKNKTHCKKPSLQQSDFSDLEGTVNQRKCTGKKRKKSSSHQELAISMKLKRSDLLTSRYSTSANESSTGKSPKLTVQRKGEEVVGKSNINGCEHNESSSKLVENILRGKEEANVENLKVFDNGINNPGERINDALEDGVTTYQKKGNCLRDKSSELLNSGGKCSKLRSSTSRKARNNELSEEKQASPGLLGPSLKLDAWSYPKRKRTHHKMQSRSSGMDDHYATLTKIDGKVHHKRPFNKILTKSSLLKELIRLGIPESKSDFTWKDLRKRRDMASVRVLLSQHLDDDIIKLQKKIMGRLGISMASCLTDATHFIADRFVRTRNMLEAIALGKPVVTHLWLESCGQARCLIDEKNYILRDAKKEKEIGFSLPVSLACARQRPLLKGRRVLITPNIKPDREMISSLIKASQGQTMEKIQTFTQNIPDDLLILSCEEDRLICAPLLDKGAAVYSSELLLNGIVIQKLKYERHQLFERCVKKNRPSKK